MANDRLEQAKKHLRENGVLSLGKFREYPNFSPEGLSTEGTLTLDGHTYRVGGGWVFTADGGRFTPYDVYQNVHGELDKLIEKLGLEHPDPESTHDPDKLYSEAADEVSKIIEDKSTEAFQVSQELQNAPELIALKEAAGRRKYNEKVLNWCNERGLATDPKTKPSATLTPETGVHKRLKL